MMKTMQDLASRELKWTQPKAMKRKFELVDDGDVLATLRFHSVFGTLATAEVGGESWTFKRLGFWRTYVTVRVAGTDKEVAIFRNNTWSAGGTLELPDGRRFRASSNFWLTGFEFTDESDQPLVRYGKFGGPIHLSSKVEITPSAAGLPELPWLVVLGWYLALKMQDDAAGGAAGAAAAG